MDTLDTWAEKRLTKLISNAPGEIRTHGLRIRNPALYPPELRGHKQNQLLTIIFFFSLCVKLCLTCAYR